MQIGGIDPTYKEEGIQLFEPLRTSLSETIDNILPYPQSALLSGIILGNQSSLPFYFRKQLQTTSTIHIVVVSGQNLTILAGFVMSLVSIFGRRKTIILTLFVIVIYSLITGFGVPVVRAAIMAGLVYTGKLMGKEGTGWWILFVTGGLMLLYQPNWLLNISFQLSFLATFGVIVVAPIFSNILRKIPKLIREDFAVTLSAQLMVLPIIAYNFNQISLAGLIANSLVLWSIPIVMISGFLAMIVGIFNNFLGEIVGLVSGILLTYFIYIVQFFSKIPGASFVIGQTNVVMWTGYYLILAVIIFRFSRRKSANMV
ncbi:MAG: ComEC/Rec2 family competence protein [Microgenomates group bacterium]